ncbi:hypothetical protein GC207_10145 [bacterium]|nr:hypothetical protein [bacterium]
MNLEEAKRILLAYRPGTDDANDPDVRAALAEAARSPDLAAWWRDQQTVRAELRDRFRSISPPANLKENILAAHKTIEIKWWRTTRFRAAAIAACLIGLISVLIWRPAPKESRFDEFRDRMVRTVIREYRMDITNNVEGEVRGFLTRNSDYPDFQLTPSLKTVPLFGAGKLTWTGHPVSMICFKRKPDVLMYLFVIDRSAFDSPPGSRPVFAEVARRATASWSDGNRVYTLTSEAGESDLKALLNNP